MVGVAASLGRFEAQASQLGQNVSGRPAVSTCQMNWANSCSGSALLR